MSASCILSCLSQPVKNKEMHSAPAPMDLISFCIMRSFVSSPTQPIHLQMLFRKIFYGRLFLKAVFLHKNKRRSDQTKEYEDQSDTIKLCGFCKRIRACHYTGNGSN